MELRAVFINLDGAVERRAFMEGQAARLGLTLERFPAFAMADITTETIDRLGRQWERPLTRPELGCFLSHHALWKEVAADGRPVLILEDDVFLSRRIGTALPAFEGFTEADFLNLETFDRRRFVARHVVPMGPGLSVVRVFRDKSGSAAYLLWPSGARKLLARAERGAAPVDAFLHGLAGLVAWQAEPALAIQAHLAAARGWPVPFDPGSSIQSPRQRLPVSLPNLPFHRRRLLTQLRLAGHHLRRLGPATFREVPLDVADFTDS